MNDDFYEPLNPDDLGLLVNLAGPLYQESKLIDSMTGNVPKQDGMHIDSGAATIRKSLESIEQQAKAAYFASRNAPQPVQTHFYPPHTVEQVVLPQPVFYPQSVPQPVNDGQLEFNFNISEQQKTNDLLEKCFRSLTKILAVVESINEQSKNRNDTVSAIPKLSVKDK